MSGTFKWLTLKAGTALGRSVSSLFYQLYYREVYREILHLTKDGTQTIEDCFKLGYLSADESAERQKAVFRFFPSNPEKVLEYVPLLWELYFGQPMQNYETEWDRTDPIHPILKYKIRVDPMTFDMGKDPLRDNLPWKKLITQKNKYGALMAGLLTQCTSYVLFLRDKPQRIILYNTKNELQGDEYFEFHCQVVEQADFPYFGFDKTPDLREHETDKTLSGADKIISQISEHIDLDILDKLIDRPVEGISLLLNKGIEKGTHMTSEELFDHFTNDEEKFLQIFGFIFIHLTNEWGQFPEKLFSKPSAAKVIAHQVKFIHENRKKLFPSSVIEDLKSFMLALFKDLVPALFYENLALISADRMFDLYFIGMEKAFSDLGVNFSDLQPSLYKELQLIRQNSSNSVDLESNKEVLYARLFNEIMLISSVLMSIPSQLSIILISNLTRGSNEILQSLFTTLREGIQKIVDILDELEDQQR